VATGGQGALMGSSAADGALALAEPDSPPAVDALTKALGHPDPSARESAALALAGLRDPASIPALARIVAGWDERAVARCRGAALRALVAFRTVGAAVALARELACAGPKPVELHESAALLAVAYAEPSGVAAPRVVRALVRLLAHENEAVAERAVSLLMLFPSESSRPLARALAAERGPDVRRRAAQALGACRHDTAVSALVTALRDPDPGVRAAAARALGDIRDPATAVALHAAGGDADEGVREAARSALHKLGTVATATSIAAGFGPVAQRSGR
jgi:HEAT repeat protein